MSNFLCTEERVITTASMIVRFLMNDNQSAILDLLNLRVQFRIVPCDVRTSSKTISESSIDVHVISRMLQHREQGSVIII